MAGGLYGCALQPRSSACTAAHQAVGPVLQRRFSLTPLAAVARQQACSVRRDGTLPCLTQAEVRPRAFLT